MVLRFSEDVPKRKLNNRILHVPPNIPKKVWKSERNI